MAEFIEVSKIGEPKDGANWRGLMGSRMDFVAEGKEYPGDF